MIKAEDQGLEPRSVFSASRFQDGLLIQPDVFRYVAEHSVVGLIGHGVSGTTIGHGVSDNISAPNEDRTRRGLIDNQVPPPGGLKGSKFLQRVTDRN